MPFDLKSITDDMWERAHQFFIDNPDALKYSKKISGFSVSIIKVNNKLFIIYPDDKNDKSSFGKIKLISERTTGEKIYN